MDAQGDGGRAAIAGFIYQALVAATQAIEIGVKLDRDPRANGLDGLTASLRPEAKIEMEGWPSADITLHLSENEAVLIQVKLRGDESLDFGDLRMAVVAFNSSLAEAQAGEAGEEGKIAALVLFTNARLTESVAECFCVARELRVSSPEAVDGYVDIAWDGRIRGTGSISEEWQGRTYGEYACELARQLNSTIEDEKRLSSDRVKEMLPILHAVAGKSWQECETELARDAKLRGVLQEELQQHMDTVLGGVLGSAIKTWTTLTRDKVLKSLTGQHQRPAGLAHPSAIQQELATRWEEWARGKDPAFDELLVTEHTSSLAGRLRSELSTGIPKYGDV